MKQTTDYNKGVNIEEFNEKNSVNLNNESNENTQKIIDEGIINVQNAFSEKLQLLGIDNESMQGLGI